MDANTSLLDVFPIRGRRINRTSSRPHRSTTLRGSPSNGFTGILNSATDSIGEPSPRSALPSSTALGPPVAAIGDAAPINPSTNLTSTQHQHYLRSSPATHDNGSESPTHASSRSYRRRPSVPSSPRLRMELLDTLSIIEKIRAEKLAQMATTNEPTSTKQDRLIPTGNNEPVAPSMTSRHRQRRHRSGRPPKMGGSDQSSPSLSKLRTTSPPVDNSVPTKTPSAFVLSKKRTRRRRRYRTRYRTSRLSSLPSHLQFQLNFWNCEVLDYGGV